MQLCRGSCDLYPLLLVVLQPSESSSELDLRRPPSAFIYREFQSLITYWHPLQVVNGEGHVFNAALQEIQARRLASFVSVAP